MKAVVYRTTGDPTVLELVDRDPLPPGKNEVRIRVAVSGVNPADCKSRSGDRPGQPLPFAEIVPNHDGAGTVEAVGTDVEHLRVGDRVWTVLAAFDRPSGTAQELTCVPASHVVRLPDNASFDEGACLGVPAVTAHRSLTVYEGGPNRLSPGALHGRFVLVAGGAGVVGHAAIQLARWAGATVIATVSSHAKGNLAAAAGAHHTVDYTRDDAAANIRSIASDGVDHIVEVSPSQNASLNMDVAAQGASIAVYANNGGDSVSVPVREAFMRNVRYQFLYTVDHTLLAHATEDIDAALSDRALRVGTETGLPLVRFPLDEAAAAHRAVEDGVVGRVLIDVT